MDKNPSLATRYFPALTGIRALAAFLVFFHHFNPFGDEKHPAAMATTMVLQKVVEQWHMGVTIFFVLSGFLIASRYQDRIEPSLGFVKQYLLNRFARIYPLYFLLTLVTFGAMFVLPNNPSYEWPDTFTNTDRLVSFFANLTLTRAFFQSFVFTGLPTAWSLTVEECFYLSAPFLLLVVRNRPRLLVVFALLLLSTGLLLCMASTRLHLYASLMRPLSFVLTFTYFGRCVEFMAGIGLALWLKRRGNFAALPGTTWVGTGIIAACVAGMVAFAWEHKATAAWPLPLGALLINNFLLPVGVVLLLHGLMHESTRLRRLLETPLFDLLGKSSYAFYLIHFGLFSDLLESAIGRNITAYFLIFNAAAVLLYKYIEHPLHKFIVRGPRPKVPAQLVAN